MKFILRLIFALCYTGMLILTVMAFSYSAIVGSIMCIIDAGVWEFMVYMWKDGMINPFTKEKLK